MKEIIFNIFYGFSNPTVIAIDSTKTIFELKANTTTALDVEFCDISLILENYGILDTEDTCELELNMLGLEEDKYYRIFVLNTANPEFNWKVFCSKKIIGKIPINQIGFICEGKKNTPICFACKYICRANEQITETILENNFYCQCSDNKDNICCFKECDKSDDKASKFQNINAILKYHAESVYKRETAKIESANAKVLARKFDFERSILFGIQRVNMYEEENVKEKVMAVIPVVEIESEAEMNSKSSGLHYKDEVVKSLLFWFKKKFFTWCDRPICSICLKTSDTYIETQIPNEEEKLWLASRTEVYKCSKCNTSNRFPRFNSPVKLCETKTGRCGEWANLFGCVLRCFKYEVRFIDNFEDHVWNEYWSESLNRWVHVDSCENAWDTPLMYEQGWGRNMTFILGYSVTGVFDVTRRYVKNWDLIVNRRSQEAVNSLTKALEVKNNNIRSALSAELIELLHTRDLSEQMELLKVKTLQETEKLGRVSGSEEWKKERGEIK